VILHFNPQTKSKKVWTEFCPEEEGILANKDLFHNALRRSKLRSGHTQTKVAVKNIDGIRPK
jgi:hypothetical protein